MVESLSTVRSKYPYLGVQIDSLATLAAQKQTYQLTHQVILFLDAAAAANMKGSDMVEFFNNFVTPYASRMGPIELVKILAKCSLTGDVNVGVGLGLLEKYNAQLLQSKNASLLGRILAAELHLKKSKNLSEARTVIDAISESLTDPIYTHSINAPVRGSFHLVASDLYLALGNDYEFYGHLLKFLTYTPLADISSETLARTTCQAGIIALIHPEINDFGELLSLPAFSDAAIVSGHGAPSWLVDFLRSIHLGNFDAFEAAFKSHHSELVKEAELLSKIDTSLRRKLTMISLAELAGFITPEKTRRLSFQQISQHCRVPVTEVEELVMTTMGVGKLIEGVIDEVDETVVITSVKPRVLDNERVIILKNRIENWAERALQLCGKMTELTPELLIS